MFKLLVVTLTVYCVFSTASIAQTTFNQPKAHTVIGAQGVPLAVQEWGNPDGIPVILVHGFGFGANAFKHQIGEVTRELRLIAPDLRGHGLSAKPWTQDAYNSSGVWADDLNAVMEALDVDKPIVVGWSFGGYVLMNYLRQYGSDSVSGAILVGSLAGLTSRPPPPDPADSNMPPMKGNARIDDYHAVFENFDWLARVMTFEAPAAKVREQKLMTLAMMPPHVKRAMVGMPLDNRDLAAAITAPILFIHGDKDGSVPQAYIDLALEALPNATSKLYAGGVGHSPFEERPKQFNADLLAFAKRYARSNP